MTTTTNSRFLAIRTPEPDINSGWSVRVLDYKDMTSLVAIISEFTEMQFTQELNAPGTGSITMDEDSPFWGQILNNGNSNRTLKDNEYVLEAWENNTPRFAWVAQTVTNTLVGEGEARTVTLSGPGIAQVLTWASINRPAWPVKVPIIAYEPRQSDPSKPPIPVWRPTSYKDTVPAYSWRFPLGWTTMHMWWTVFKAAQRRGLIRWVTPMFGPLYDSGGQAWLEVKTIELEASLKIKYDYRGYQPETPSENLLDFLNDCTGQDYSKWFGQRLEWIMHPGFKLDVRRTIGVKRHLSVRFFQGNVISDDRTRDREAIYNRVISVDVIGNETNRTDARSVARWNLREIREEADKNITDNVKLKAALADRRLAQHKDEKDSWAIKIPYGDPGRQPYRDFQVGDWIGVNIDYYGSTPTAVAEPNQFRVMAISISIGADQTVPDCELTLKSIIDLRQDDLQKQITALINNPRNFSLAKLKEIAGTSPSDGDALVYDGETNTWGPGEVSGKGGAAGSMWVQSTDPTLDSKNTVNAGDFWLETYD